MTYRNLNNIIILLLLIGLVTSLDLVIKEVQVGRVCPAIGAIPACYLASIYFFLLLITQLKRNKNMLFFIFASLGLALSLFASVGHRIGNVICPISFFRIPLCFVALLIFTVIVILKFIQLRKNKNL